MKADKLREKSTEELNQELLALKEQLFKLRFQHATRQLDNPVQLRLVKKDIARVNTIIRQRELEVSKK